MITIWYCLIYRKRWPNTHIKYTLTNSTQISKGTDLGMYALQLIMANQPKGYRFQHITIADYNGSTTLYERNE